MLKLCLAWWNINPSSFLQRNVAQFCSSLTQGSALERTFLAYMRTAAALSMQGVLIAQLFRLQGSHSAQFDFYTVGIPLSVVFHACAILVTAMGAFRFWRQQHAIARGKVYAGGWEINSIGLIAMTVGFASFPWQTED